MLLQVKREGRGQGLVQYELEPQLPGRGAKLMRGYCYSRSKAGVGRWVVDVQVPVCLASPDAGCIMHPEKTALNEGCLRLQRHCVERSR